MALLYIGIGSNLGNRKANCLAAVGLLGEQGISVTKQSSLYETRPWGVTDQPDFVNMAVEAQTGLDPSEVLGRLKMIEKSMGRQETGRWGPRIIDLDLLLYDDVVLQTPGLTVPHPLMHEREFVLKPLSEIAGDMVHPVLKRKISELLAALTASEE